MTGRTLSVLNALIAGSLLIGFLLKKDRNMDREMTDDIRKQLDIIQEWATALDWPNAYDTEAMQEMLIDIRRTMESLLTRNEALEKVLEAANIYRKHMTEQIEPVMACGIHLDEAIADCNTEQGN